MARRRARSKRVRGRPNYIWISTAGEFSLIQGNTTWDAVLIPADWSGTVTEQSCTLERLVISAYAVITDDTGLPMAQNTCVVLGNANEAGGTSTLDISWISEWPDFFENYDRVLHIGRLEWDGTSMVRRGNELPVQFSQLPDPVVNLKCRRRLLGDDTVRFCCGGQFTQQTTEIYVVNWFCRALVRIGLK